jgi:hypothetical protein
VRSTCRPPPLLGRGPHVRHHLPPGAHAACNAPLSTIFSPRPLSTRHRPTLSCSCTPPNAAAVSSFAGHRPTPMMPLLSRAARRSWLHHFAGEHLCSTVSSSLTSYTIIAATLTFFLTQDLAGCQIEDSHRHSSTLPEPSRPCYTEPSHQEGDHTQQQNNEVAVAGVFDFGGPHQI